MHGSEDKLLEELDKALREPRGSLRCWAAYLLISMLPPGFVVAYRALAEVLETSPRGIAACMRGNRLAPIIPCHRVVAADGRLGGYSRGGSRVKEALLRLEGVRVENGRVERVIRDANEFWRLLESIGRVVELNIDQETRIFKALGRALS